MKFTKPENGEYKFDLSNITGRQFTVLYSTGDTYFGNQPKTEEEEQAEVTENLIEETGDDDGWGYEVDGD